MLRLLIVTLLLVVAAFDEQEADAIQFEVRSPPESRPLLPAAPQETTQQPLHSTPRTHNTHAHTSPCTRRGARARARRPTPRSTSSPTSSSPGTSTLRSQVCVPARPAATHAARAAFGRPCRCARARKTGAHAAGAHARARAVRCRACPPTYEPAERRASLRATQRALAIGTC